MNRVTFKREILYPRIEKIKETLDLKAGEYASLGSAFYNFERSGKINNQHPKQALWGMASKHLVSIIDMVENNEVYESEYIDDKIGDMINYLILLEGIFKNEIEK